MQNETLVNSGKQILKDLLKECTEPQQLMFKRMYSHENLELPIDEAIDQMNPDKIDHAITQAERTVASNKAKASQEA